MFIVVVLRKREFIFIKACHDKEDAAAQLSQWCYNNWQLDEWDRDDFTGEDLITRFFRDQGVWTYRLQPLQESKDLKTTFAVEQVQPDILLTPGMCAIISRGLENIKFSRVAEILGEYQELVPGGKEEHHRNSSAVIRELLKQFE